MGIPFVVAIVILVLLGVRRTGKVFLVASSGPRAFCILAVKAFKDISTLQVELE